MTSSKQIQAFGTAIELSAVLEEILDGGSQYPGSVSADTLRIVRRARVLSGRLERDLKPAASIAPTWSPDGVA